eukprot:g1404.t1
MENRRARSGLYSDANHRLSLDSSAAISSLRQDSEAGLRSQSWADLRNALPDDETHCELPRCGSLPAQQIVQKNRVGINTTQLCLRVILVLLFVFVARLLSEHIRRTQSVVSFPTSESDNALHHIEEMPGENVIMVSNRLPVSAAKINGEWELKESAGGLVSALRGVQHCLTKWIGWPGVFIEEGPDRDDLSAKLKEKNFIPVWLDSDLISGFYNGYCNNILWPLFHYVPLSTESWHSLAGSTSMENEWKAYQTANKIFADHVLAHHDMDDAIVWVHDYHLMLLPRYLKEVKQTMKVGWFLHTPFPSSEIYRTLPHGEVVLSSVLAADLLGFHTYDYARHFISSSSRILGLEGTPKGVEDQGHITRVITCPIGINVERFRQAMASREVLLKVEEFKKQFHGRKVLLGVDRLDMIKGIPQKLLAYEKFLEEHPEWRTKVLFVQVAVPTRQNVLEYQRLRAMVHEMVGRINGAYGSITQMPIHFLNQSLNLNELVALYFVTDVALITSLRDGMNLVSFEYVACQSGKHIPGGLILSEFAGAAQSLGAGSLLVNPWNTTDMAQAILDCLTMRLEERIERHQENYHHITKHTAQTWAETFITELNDCQIEARLRNRQTPPVLTLDILVPGIQESQLRLFVLGYNATLTTHLEAPRQFRRHYDQMKSLARVNPKTMQSVRDLCSNPENTVVIFSGSECSKMEELFSDMPVWLIAENGVYLKPPITVADSTWIPMFDRTSKDWMDAVKLVFDYFCERTPRSFVETRETSLVWNFKYADVEFGRIQANDLLQHLRGGPISNEAVDIIPGARSVEVRPKGLTKGVAMQHAIGEMEQLLGTEAVCFDLVLCIGHFLIKDENIFEYFEGRSLCKEARVERSSSYIHLSQAPDYDDLRPAAISSSLGSNGLKRGSISPTSDVWQYNMPPVLSPKHIFTCTVGRNASYARYSLASSQDVADVLHDLVQNLKIATDDQRQNTRRDLI